MVSIAIIGIGCRFPGGITDATSFWNFVSRKGDAVMEIPASRWDVDRYYDADPEAPGRMYTRHGSFLPDPFWSFDYGFFGISRREAMTLDPQQRHLLEVSWEALDDAGIAGSVNGHEIGTFIGGFTNDHVVARARAFAHTLDAISSFAATSSSQTLLSNRISHALDLRGPSMTVDTACSSSLVATHLAVRAIAGGECDVALAGGANLIFQPETFVTMCKGRFLSVDGRCKSFEASADGYGRGEGVGIVVLKSLEQALRDRDSIYAVIRGSGVNQDGKTLALPVPSADSQQRLAERVCRGAGVEPAEVAFVEAHGTGTAVGDPIEAAALGNVYGIGTGRVSELPVGSVKNNFGHTEAAAGVAGLIKAALTVKNGCIAPQARVGKLNPAIPFDKLGIVVPVEPRPLLGKYAAVNSFGYGGTNAHVLVERTPEMPVSPETATPRGVSIFPVSARSIDALASLAGSYANLVAASSSDSLPELEVSVGARRAHHHLRIGLPYRNSADLESRLREFAQNPPAAVGRTLVEGIVCPVFVFSGMGPQWWGMGRSLLEEAGRFAEKAAEIDKEFANISGWSIVDALLKSEESSQLHLTEKAQPANFLIQAALVDQLAEFGVVPAAVVGHSVGEISAAYVSGALTLSDAVKIAHHRSRLQATTAGSGGMLAVGIGEQDADAIVEKHQGRICIAAINGPTSITLAGDASVLKNISDSLTADGVFARKLRVEVPYHSHLMDPILDELKETLLDMRPQPCHTPVYSTVTGAAVDGPEFGTAAYWQRNVREPVVFGAALEKLLDENYRVFLEVGPHPVLSGNIREALIRRGISGVAVSTLNRDNDAQRALSQAVCNLYACGAIERPASPLSTAIPVPNRPLPTYPWNRAEAWEEDPKTLRHRYGDDNRFALLGDRTDSTTSEWEVTLGQANLPWLRDHHIAGTTLLPAAGFIDAGLSAAIKRSRGTQCGIDNLVFSAPLVIDEHDVPTMRVAVDSATKGFVVRSRSANSTVWSGHSSGRLVEFPTGAEKISIPRASADETIIVTRDEIYPALKALGLRYGPAFQRIDCVRISGSTCVAELAPFIDEERAAHVVHPAVADAALQCAAVLLASSIRTSELSATHLAETSAHVPTSVDRVRFYKEIPTDALAVVRINSIAPLSVDAFITDRNGDVGLAMHGVEFSPIGTMNNPLDSLGNYFYEREWLQLDPLGTSSTPGSPAVQRINLVVEIGDISAAVLGGMPGISSGNAVRHRASYEQRSNVETLTRILEGRFRQDRYLRLALVLGAGASQPTDVSWQVIQLAQAISRLIDSEADQAAATRIQVVVITQNGLMAPSDTALDVGHCGAVGARRTIANEMFPVQWTLIDIDTSTTAEQVVAELGNGTTAECDEVAIRHGGVRWAERLNGTAAERADKWEVPSTVESPDDAYEIETPRTRLLKDIRLRACRRVPPSEREIEIRIETIGLNYKDALKVSGILGHHQLSGTYFGTEPGMEAFGVVTRTGSAVTGIVPGDRMILAQRHILRRYTRISLDGGGAWVHIAQETPEEIVDPLAIGSGLPFLTAIYALKTIAKVQPDEIVLVHGGAGGMGSAAIQVAASMGATVIATASSDDRRAIAVSRGATHVFDSRSTAFVEDVLAVTGGRGADVIFNSSPGEVISQNLNAVAEFGRIVEIGKADVFFGGAVDLSPFKKNIAFHAIDMDRLLAADPAGFKRLMSEGIALLAQGGFEPIRYNRFPVTELPAAFEAVLRSNFVGRVVVDLRDQTPDILPQRPAAWPVSPGATYLVTGGFGAFGLATARALAHRGARRIALVGRFGATSAAQRRQVDALRMAGVTVLEESADISNPSDVEGLLDRVGTPDAPLKGIFHTASIVKDQPIIDITYESLNSVLAPKVLGALNIVMATRKRGIDLDCLVLYSSISAVTGTSLQTSYVAANTALDGLASSWRSAGLPATSVNWGVMSGGGMAESSEAVAKYVELLGFKSLNFDVAAALMFESSRFGLANYILADVDWSDWRNASPGAAISGRFAKLAARASETPESEQLRAAFLALPSGERVPTVLQAIVAQLAEVLAVEPETIGVDDPISRSGNRFGDGTRVRCSGSEKAECAGEHVSVHRRPDSPDRGGESDSHAHGGPVHRPLIGGQY